MKYIAIDTSTQALSLALIQDEEVVASSTLQPKRQHGELLVPAVAGLMEQMNWQVADLAGLIVGVGPGSYTGLRIGATFVKTWAVAKQLPVYPVSSLGLMASGTDKGKATLIIPVMDARRHSAYTGVYQWNGLNQKLEPVIEDAHVEWREWLETTIAPLQSEAGRVVLVGDKIEEFVDSFKELLPETTIEVMSGWAAVPQAERAVHLNWIEIEDATLLTPNYAHATLAEREWATKNNTKIASDQDNEAFIEHFKE